MLARLIDALTENPAVRSGKINELKNTQCRLGWREGLD
jgi:hypothetical protein